MPEFEHLGYFKEYYIGQKYIGQVQCEKDRDTIGFAGRKTEKIETPIAFSKTKKIKAGTEVTTILYPICGKIVKS